MAASAESAPPSIRIRLDLSDFVEDESRFRWMHLSRERFSTVSDLARQLREEYGPCEGRDVTLFLEEPFVLASWESIDILRDGDIVKAKLREARKRKKSLKESVAAVAPAKRKRKSMASSERKPTLPAPKEKKKDTSSSSSTSEEDKKQPPEIEQMQDERVKITRVANPHSLDPSAPRGHPLKKRPPPPSSSSSDSSRSEEEEPAKKPLAKSMQPSAGSKESSSSSSDDCAEVTSNAQNVKVVKQDAQKRVEEQKKLEVKVVQAPTKAKAPSSSSNDSSDDPAGAHDPNKTVADKEKSSPKKRKRKRKRKNKNKNVLKEGEKLQNKRQELKSIPAEKSAPLPNPTKNISATSSPGPSTTPKTPSATPRLEASSSALSCEDVLLSTQELAKSNTSIRNQAQKARPENPKPKEISAVLREKNPAPRATAATDVSQSNNGFDKLLQLASSSSPVVGRYNRGKERTASASGNGGENSKPGNLSATSTAVRQYDKLPSLMSMPSCRQKIAFRALEILEDYTPGLSGYQEGEVIEVDGLSSLTLWVTSGQKRQQNGKFEIAQEGDESAAAEKFIKTYAWEELIDPRLLET